MNKFTFNLDTGDFRGKLTYPSFKFVNNKFVDYKVKTIDDIIFKAYSGGRAGAYDLGTDNKSKDINWLLVNNPSCSQMGYTDIVTGDPFKNATPIVDDWIKLTRKSHKTAEEIRKRIEYEEKLKNVYAGTIPVGTYKMSKSDRNGCIKLSALKPNNRTGLLIHMTGVRGSDGCIVPQNKRNNSKVKDMVDIFEYIHLYSNVYRNISFYLRDSTNSITDGVSLRDALSLLGLPNPPNNPSEFDCFLEVTSVRGKAQFDGAFCRSTLFIGRYYK